MAGPDHIILNHGPWKCDPRMKRSASRHALIKHAKMDASGADRQGQGQAVEAFKWQSHGVRSVMLAFVVDLGLGLSGSRRFKARMGMRWMMWNKDGETGETNIKSI